MLHQGVFCDGRFGHGRGILEHSAGWEIPLPGPVV